MTGLERLDKVMPLVVGGSRNMPQSSRNRDSSMSEDDEVDQLPAYTKGGRRTIPIGDRFWATYAPAASGVADHCAMLAFPGVLLNDSTTAYMYALSDRLLDYPLSKTLKGCICVVQNDCSAVIRKILPSSSFESFLCVASYPPRLHLQVLSHDVMF